MIFRCIDIIVAMAQDTLQNITDLTSVALSELLVLTADAIKDRLKEKGIPEAPLSDRPGTIRIKDTNILWRTLFHDLDWVTSQWTQADQTVIKQMK